MGPTRDKLDVWKSTNEFSMEKGHYFDLNYTYSLPFRDLNEYPMTIYAKAGGQDHPFTTSSEPVVEQQTVQQSDIRQIVSGHRPMRLGRGWGIRSS